MRIAYCIVCHRKTIVLSELVSILSKDNDVYIHVDLKTDITPFLHEYYDKVTFIANRVDVRWGSFSQVQTTLNFIDETLKKPYDYICLLSGDCLPLKSDAEIKKVLQEKNGTEFIGISMSENYKKIEDRVRYNYTSWNFQRNKDIISVVVRKIHHIFRPIFFRNNDFSRLPRLYKGPNWIMVTQDFCKYVIDYLANNSWYLKAFKRSYCCDEIFFQTIVMNSSFRDRVNQKDSTIGDNQKALRYVDFSESVNKIITEEKYNEIRGSECLFGRKFPESVDIENYRRCFGIL